MPEINPKFLFRQKITFGFGKWSHQANVLITVDLKVVLKDLSIPGVCLQIVVNIPRSTNFRKL